MKYIMTSEEITKKGCRRAAKRDIENGLGCVAERHGADGGSAWAKWYNDAYIKLSNKPLPMHPF